jgi:hypothetical protein
LRYRDQYYFQSFILNSPLSVLHSQLKWRQRCLLLLPTATEKPPENAGKRRNAPENAGKRHPFFPHFPPLH